MSKVWLTEIKAIKPGTNELRTYGGPNVPGISISDAELYCQQNGLGYCTVIGELSGIEWLKPIQSSLKEGTDVEDILEFTGCSTVSEFKKQWNKLQQWLPPEQRNL